jgi:glycosyltransferase involved in cell wall biosynthesis
MTSKFKVFKPFVSVITPTYNRRPFIPYLVKSFLAQDYPQNRLEWIVVDDGSDKIHDLLPKADNIKYVALADKLTLGAKRNLSHQYATGTIIVYMDDDDYYPPERVSHAVTRLMANPYALCAGSSALPIYFKDLNCIYMLGPYNKNHATAGTFAFKRTLLADTAYQDDATFAEEKHFLKNYTVPFVQLDPLKTILVISHKLNTFDKHKCLTPNNPFVHKTPLNVSDFIKAPDMRDFYENRIHGLLKKYRPIDIDGQTQKAENNQIPDP